MNSRRSPKPLAVKRKGKGQNEGKSEAKERRSGVFRGAGRTKNEVTWKGRKGSERRGLLPRLTWGLDAPDSRDSVLTVIAASDRVQTELLIERSPTVISPSLRNVPIAVQH